MIDRSFWYKASGHELHRLATNGWPPPQPDLAANFRPPNPEPRAHL